MGMSGFEGDVSAGINMWMGTAFGQLLAKVPFARTGVGGQTASPLDDRDAGFGLGYLNGWCPSGLFGSTAMPALRKVSNPG
jgi:hypothetical protein